MEMIKSPFSRKILPYIELVEFKIQCQERFIGTSNAWFVKALKTGRLLVNFSSYAPSHGLFSQELSQFLNISSVTCSSYFIDYHSS